jgi:hypothetical protein
MRRTTLTVVSLLAMLPSSMVVAQGLKQQLVGVVSRQIIQTRTAPSISTLVLTRKAS